jgi:hypothetical protein
MAGRSQYTNADIDCVVKAVVKLWGYVPMRKDIHVVTKLGGSVAEDVTKIDSDQQPMGGRQPPAEGDLEDADGNQRPMGGRQPPAGGDLEDAEGNRLTARIVDYGISFPSVLSAAVDSTAEIKFHEGHTLGLLFRTLMEKTNTFTVHMPEAAYRMNANVRAGRVSINVCVVIMIIIIIIHMLMPVT